MLKGQDLLVAFHLAGSRTDTLATMSRVLFLSIGEIHNALARLQEAQLVLQSARDVHRAHLAEFAIHGARFSFPPKMGRIARGVPTAQSAAPLVSILAPSSAETNLVWKHPEGTRRAPSVEPIYRSAPSAALHNAALYRKLALLDAIRCGGARIRELATDLLAQELGDERR